MKTEKIESFTGTYRFLSNFCPASVWVDNDRYPTVEHGFQASKTIDMDERAKILVAKTPGEAKRLGRKVTLVLDWEKVKLDVMRDLVRQKFTNDKVLRADLLATGDAVLVEGNTWGDVWWGVCRGKGQNWLGRILMEIRSELRK